MEPFKFYLLAILILFAWEGSWSSSVILRNMLISSKENMIIRQDEMADSNGKINQDYWWETKEDSQGWYANLDLIAESEVEPLTVNGTEDNEGESERGGNSASVILRETAVPVPAPEDRLLKAPVLPPGMSYCAKNGTVSSTESPIALGRPTRWKITELGSNAKELPRNGQRISVNKYYPGLRDTFFMENDGFNLIFYLNETHPWSELRMKVKEWEDEYVFAKGILHWGSEDAFGSEHTIHGRRFPLEIQFVHFKNGLGSLEQAEDKDLGVMIASVVYYFSGFEKNYLDPILKQTAAVSYPGKRKEVHGPLVMTDLFPHNLAYYEYRGSFTTKPCGKKVKRIVFANNAGVGRDQLRALQKIVRNANGKRLANNYQQLQDVGGRQIIFNPIEGKFDVQNSESLMEKDPKRHW